MSFKGEINLRKSFFSEKPVNLFLSDDFKTKTFMYESGVLGIKLENSKGYITILPYMGQMVWDAIFGGRNLSMKTTFSQPIPTNFFLNTYGAFMIHCGALRMGHPGPKDTHQLHGELPCAEYRDVKIILDEDVKGKYVAVSGIYEHNIAFDAHYYAIPMIKLFKNSSLIEISIKIENLSYYPMELMYLTHINFRAVMNSRIVQSLGWTKDDLLVRESIPLHVNLPKGYREFITKLKQNPTLARTIKSKDIYRPEVAFSIGKPLTDNIGFAHYLLIHPDGTSDYVSYKPEEFGHGSRWFCISKDSQVLGLILPATAGVEGYNAEKNKGNIKIILGKESKSFSVIAGYLDKDETKEKELYISAIIKNKTRELL